MPPLTFLKFFRSILEPFHQDYCYFHDKNGKTIYIIYISRDLLFIVYISLKAFKNIDHDKTDESINKLQRLEDGRCLLVQKKEIVQMC